MLRYHNLKSKRGFTLVEMLVAIFIFSLVISVTVALFTSGLREQRNALSAQQLLNQTSFTLEYMSRALRMALKQDPILGRCLSQDGSNYEIVSSSRLRFINHLENDDCQEFFLEDGQLKQNKNNLAETVFLTSDKLKVNQLQFNLRGQGQPPSDTDQPRVTLSLEIEGRGFSSGSAPKLHIQTTISQRNLDVQQ